MMTGRAYAKINIGLNILRKRADGYHDIETIFHRVDIFDELSFAAAPTISIECDSAEIPADERNLCFRAAALLQEHYNVNEGVRIQLRKTIPVGAGLGGGSSDAAVTLLALSKLWNLDASERDLHPFAVQLGSDVAYFLRAGSASASGRGGELNYFPLDVPYRIGVIFPGIPVSTAWAYQNVRLNQQTDRFALADTVIRNIAHPSHLRNDVKNDFEDLVLEQFPEIRIAKRLLEEHNAVFTQLSGSGSAVYGFFASDDHLRLLQTTITPPMQLFITQPHFQPAGTLIL